MITQVFCDFLGLEFLGVKKLESLAGSLVWNSSFSSQIPSYKGGIFSRFFLVSRREMAYNFSFLARNQNARKMPPIIATLLLLNYITSTF